jgi:predicted ATPase
LLAAPTTSLSSSTSRRASSKGSRGLGPQQRDAARRFNIPIDTLYEAGTLLIASAEVWPEAIYAAGADAFESPRTVSRPIEMQSEDYIANRPRR